MASVQQPTGLDLVRSFGASAGQQAYQATREVTPGATGLDLVRSFGQKPKKKTLGTAFAEVGERPAEFVPYVQYGVAAKDLYDDVTALEATATGKGTPEQVARVRKYLEPEAEETFGYKAASSLLHMLPNVVEFAAAAFTGGAAGAASLGGMAAKKAATQIAKGALAKQAAKSARDALLVRGARAAGAIGGTLLAREGMSAALTGLAPGVPLATPISTSALRAAMPDLALTEDQAGRAQVVLQGSTGEFLEALPAGVANELIEVASEFAGGPIGKLLKAVPGAATVAAAQGKVLGWLGSKIGVDDALERLATAGWNGPIQEYLEEVAGAVAREGASALPGLGKLEGTFPGLHDAAAILALGVGLAPLAGVTPKPKAVKAAQAQEGPQEAQGEEQVEDAPKTLTERLREQEAPAARLAVLEAAGAGKTAKQAFPGGSTVEIEEGTPAAGWRQEMAGSGVDLVLFRGSETGETRPAAWLAPGVVGMSEEVLARDPSAFRKLRAHELVHELGEIDELYKELAAADLAGLQAAEEGYTRDWRATGGRELSEAQTREEGVAFRAETLATYIDFASTPEGRASLETIARNNPSLFQRILDAVRRVLRRVGIDLKGWQERELDKLRRRLGAPGRTLTERDLASVQILSEALGTLRGRVPPSRQLAAPSAGGQRLRRGIAAPVAEVRGVAGREQLGRAGGPLEPREKLPQRTRREMIPSRLPPEEPAAEQVAAPAPKIPTGLDRIVMPELIEGREFVGVIEKGGKLVPATRRNVRKADKQAERLRARGIVGSDLPSTYKADVAQEIEETLPKPRPLPIARRRELTREEQALAEYEEGGEFEGIKFAAQRPNEDAGTRIERASLPAREYLGADDPTGTGTDEMVAFENSVARELEALVSRHGWTFGGFRAGSFTSAYADVDPPDSLEDASGFQVRVSTHAPANRRSLWSFQPQHSARTHAEGLAEIEERIEREVRDAGGEQPRFTVQRPPRRLLPAQREAFGAEQVEADRSGVAGFIQRWVDSWDPIKRLQDAIVEAKGTLTADAYLTEKLRKAKTGTEARAFRKDYLDPLLEAVKASGVTLETAGDHVEYRHADERDDFVRTRNPEMETGSGWTAERRAAHEATIEGKDLSEVERLWDRAWRALRAKWVEYGLESQEAVDALEQQFKHYSPMRGFRDEPMADVLGWGRGISLRGGETRQALGRSSAAANPFAFLLQDIEKTMRRGEKARVDAALIELIEGNPTLGWGSLSVPHIRRVLNEKTGLVETQFDPGFANDPNVVPLRHEGKNRYLTLSPEFAHLAPILKGETPEMLEGLRTIGKVTRGMAALSVRWNPFFIPYNFVRDVGQALFLTASEQGLGAASRLAGTLLRHGATYMRAYTWAKTNPTGKPSTPTQALAQRYLRAGAEVTFLDLGGMEAAMSELRQALETPGPAQRLGRAVTRTLGTMQDAVENLTRLATFEIATERGIPEDQAAFAAKNISTNFEQRGEYGTWLNTFYAFSTAGIGGNARLLEGLAKGPFGRRVLLGTIGGAVLIDAMNAALSGDDEDGTSYYDNIPDWEKRTNLILMNPLSDSGDYFKIPLPYGFNILHVLGTMTGHVARGAKDAREFSGEMVSAAADAFNPLGGGTDLADVATPTVLDPIVQVARNRAWHGGPIRPPYQDIDRRLPDSEKFYPATANPMLVRFARLANKLTGGSSSEPGVLDISPETLEHLFSAYTGGLGGEVSRIAKIPFLDAPEVADVPLARRAYGVQRASRHRTRYMQEKLRLDRVELGLKQQETPEERGRYIAEHRDDLVLSRGIRRIDAAIQRLRDAQKSVESEERDAQITRLYILANARMAQAKEGE